MELKKGMYVRTKKGQIGKIIDMYDNSGSLHEENYVWALDNGISLAYNSQKVIKASFNLIDLIKVGDYVNGVKVTEIKDGKPYHEDYNDPYFSYYFEENNIKDIVTKEQFNACKYVVERDK